MNVRDRIRSFRRVRANQLRPHPRNWRTHPPAQRDAVRGILTEVGYADALLAREREDGELELIDGHLRAELTPDTEVPVLVLDLTNEEADKLLLALDPLSSLAGSDRDQLQALLAEVATDNDALQSMFVQLADRHDVPPPEPPSHVSTEPPLTESFTLLVNCASEAEQGALYERLTSEGYACRVLSL